MKMSNIINYQRVSRIFSLDSSNGGLYVPPKDYDLFLSDCVKEFKRFTLMKHKSSSLEEAKQKYQKRIKKLNPKMNETELSKYFFDVINFEVYGFVKELELKRKLNIEKERFLLYHPPYFIKDKSEISLEKYVDEFDKKLNEKFPNRRGKMKQNLFPNRRENMRQDFEFALKLKDISNLSETNIKLRNWGAISKSPRSFIQIQAIQIESEVITGPSRIPIQMVDNLEEIVRAYYGIHSIDYEMSHQEMTK